MPLLLVLLLVGTLLPVDAAPKVFGLGLSKTGTTSLGDALTALGYRNRHYDPTFVPYMLPPGVFSFQEHFKDVDSAQDIPVALYYKELLAAFPDAKFILTMREPEEWYESYSHHFEDYKVLYFKGCHYTTAMRKYTQMAYGSDRNDKDLWISQYKDHYAAVQRTIPASQLLVLNLFQGDGWDILCKFLQTTVGPCLNPSGAFFSYVNSKEWRESELAGSPTLAPATTVTTTVSPSDKQRFAYVCFAGQLNTKPGKLMFQSCLAAAKSIRATGSQHDIVVVLYRPFMPNVNETLASNGLKSFTVRELYAAPLSEDSIARARLQILDLEPHYDRLLVFHHQVRFIKNCDALFEKPSRDFEGRAGANGPIDMNFYLVRPSVCNVVDMKDMLKTTAFNNQTGWFAHGKIAPWHTGKAAEYRTDWTFPNAHTDAGILFYYYFGLLGGSNSVLHSPNMWGDRFRLVD
eukprot:m.90369 g.90369  ORF g.90369 m.90369 type:complete len:461 (+) comp51098_c0_seq2:3-1385(+)